MAAGCVGLVLWPVPLTLWRVGFALTAGIVAYAGLVFPERLGAMPHPAWGWAIALWGVAVLLPLGLATGADARPESPAGRY